MKILLLSFLFAALTLCAADVTGKWSGSFEIQNGQGESRSVAAFLTLKQDGAKLTGTAGENPEEQPGVLTGRVEGDQLIFTVEHEGHMMNFKLRQDGDALKGELRAEHGNETRIAAVSLKKVKD